MYVLPQTVLYCLVTPGSVAYTLKSGQRVWGWKRRFTSHKYTSLKVRHSLKEYLYEITSSLCECYICMYILSLIRMLHSNQYRVGLVGCIDDIQK